MRGHTKFKHTRAHKLLIILMIIIPIFGFFGLLVIGAFLLEDTDYFDFEESKLFKWFFEDKV